MHADIYHTYTCFIHIFIFIVRSLSTNIIRYEFPTQVRKKCVPFLSTSLPNFLALRAFFGRVHINLTSKYVKSRIIVKPKTKHRTCINKNLMEFQSVPLCLTSFQNLCTHPEKGRTSLNVRQYNKTGTCERGPH